VSAGSSEHRAITAGITVVYALGIVARLGPAGERFVSAVFAGLAGLAVLALAVAALRRELRIRRRLAAIGQRPPRTTGSTQRGGTGTRSMIGELR
jgi:hypothetical protein